MDYTYLSFDIETIPQPIELRTKDQEKQFEKKVPAGSTEAYGNMMCSLDPFLGKILCIGLHYKQVIDGLVVIDDAKALASENEKKDLIEFWNIVEKLPKGTQLLSFNGINFDIPFIRIRSLANGVKIPFNRVNFFNTDKYRHSNHIDLMVAIKGDKYLGGISTTLGLASTTLGIKSPKEDGIDGSTVYSEYKKGKMKEIAAYVARDSRANGQVYERLIELGYL